MTVRNYYRSPLGWIEVQRQGAAVSSLRLVSAKSARGNLLAKNSRLFAQLEAYFQKRTKVFSVRLSVSGTPFQNRVWRALNTI